MSCIQLAALDLLKSSNPNGHFWIKIDATDIKRCIMESQRKVWNGDEDLGDGKLEALRDEYEKRMADMHRLKSRYAVEVKEVLPRVLDDFTADITFLDKGFKEAADHFEKKSRQANCPEETLKEANWEVVESKSCCSNLKSCIRTLKMHLLVLLISPKLMQFCLIFTAWQQVVLSI